VVVVTACQWVSVRDVRPRECSLSTVPRAAARGVSPPDHTWTKGDKMNTVCKRCERVSFDVDGCQWESEKYERARIGLFLSAVSKHGRIHKPSKCKTWSDCISYMHTRKTGRILLLWYTTNSGTTLLETCKVACCLDNA
jgi:hypothetical protein